MQIEFTKDKFISEEDAKKYPLFMASQITDYIDPLIMLSSFRNGSHDTYLSAGDDPLFEKLFVTASHAQSFDEKFTAVRAASQYLYDHSVCVALLERRYFIHYDSTKVKSLGTQLSPIILNIQNIEKL